MYNTVLFDLDGTLTNSELGITTCVQHALKRFGIEVEDRTALRSFIGPPLGESFQVYYGLSKEESEQAILYYRERFSTIGLYENEVYEGVEKMLQNLKKCGKKLIIATSKPEKFTLLILEHFDLLKYFDFVAGATLDGSRGEKADVIRYALEMCKIKDKSDVIMVGDRKFDVLGAKENDLKSIGVLYGFGNYEELLEAGADYIVETADEITKLLCV